MDGVAGIDNVAEEGALRSEAPSEADTTRFEDKAIETDLLLKNAMQERTDAFLRCCFNLKLTKDKKYYKTQSDSWDEYVASVGLTTVKANKMVKLAFVVEAATAQTGRIPCLGGIDEDRLIKDWLPLVQYDKNIHFINNRDEALELLEQAKTLSYSDFQAIADQHKQRTEHPEVELKLEDGPVLDENNNVIGNYTPTKATGRIHYFKVGILDHYIKGYEGQALKVNFGKVKGSEVASKTEEDAIAARRCGEVKDVLVNNKNG